MRRLRNANDNAGVECAGHGTCKDTEGVCVCVNEFEPYGKGGGEAGTCENAANADSSAIGGFVSLCALVTIFIPCLCFPWVYRFDRTAERSVLDPAVAMFKRGGMAARAGC